MPKNIKMHNKSLEKINNTVSINTNGKFSKKLLSYLGPGLLVAVGYMNPGNWITSMQGGAQFRYILLFVILLARRPGMLLQSITVKVGIATGMDLAHATKYYLKKTRSFVFWIIAEVANIETA